jgi:uncharacterized coiled-coil DUF342 family protein
VEYHNQANSDRKQIEELKAELLRVGEQLQETQHNRDQLTSSLLNTEQRLAEVQRAMAALEALHKSSEVDFLVLRDQFRRSTKLCLLW